jgi:F0F1-type ATP synthase assembly protein I
LHKECFRNNPENKRLFNVYLRVIKENKQKPGTKMLSEEDKHEIRRKIESLKKKEDEIKKDFKSKTDENNKQNSFQYTHVGFEFVITFLLFFFAGRKLDQMYNGKSIILIISIFLGLGISMYRLVKEAQKIT